MTLKNFISKHLYEFSYVIVKIMPIYQTDDYSLLKKKKKKKEKIHIFKPILNRH